MQLESDAQARTPISREDFEMDLLSVIQSSFAEYFRIRVQERVHELVEPLSSEQIWQRPFPYGNSIGNLILHLTET
jgi:hypothetical protein